MSSFGAKKFFIKTYGCQANVADSNKTRGMLENLGFEEIPEPKSSKNELESLKQIISKADLFIINTCSVRQKAEDKVYGLGKIFKNLKKKPFVVLCGCMVGSATGDRARMRFKDLRRKTPWVDLYVNPSQIGELPNLLEVRPPHFVPPNGGTTWGIRAFVTISSGCDNFCTYCVVPYARGEETHKTEGEIMTEIENLVKKGITSVTLCGQNVNSWGLSRSEKFKIRAGSSQKLPFANLLRKIHDIKDIEKIEFISSNPFDFTQDLIDVFNLPKISNYLHIAVQSGNNDMLTRMNRRHTVEDFIALVKKIREVRPNIEIGTDALVGFPGETRKQFLDTVKLFRRINFAVAFIAMYSPREGTTAFKNFHDDVSPSEKKYRHAYLMKVWQESKKR